MAKQGTIVKPTSYCTEDTVHLRAKVDAHH